MSIRHYSSRRNRRSGISHRAQVFLQTILAISILLQISYPLINGETLRLVTIATVYSSALAMVLHAYYSFGSKYVAIYLPITLLFGFGIEQIGMRTTWPFGSYTYDSSLGFQVFGVPLVVPFAWVMMAHPVLVLARRISKNWVFLVGGIAMMGWDLFLDPQMVAANRWTWTFDGAHVPFQSEIPLSNAFGWLFAGIAITALLHLLLPRDRRKSSAGFAVVDIFLLWTLFAGLIGNLFFFDRPGVALVGGIVFGSVIAPYVFSRWLGRP